MPSEYRAIWSTPGGGTGYSVFHFQDVVSNTQAQGLANAVRAFFLTVSGVIPDDCTVSFDSEVTVYTLGGVLTGVFPVTPPAPTPGLTNATFNRAAGVRIDWGTGHIVAGRRLTGRTYIVPAGAGAFDSTGLVNSANITALTNAGQALITACSSIQALVVWSKTHGIAWAIDTASVPTKGAILTGRRD
jgi:hypothetical protein